MADFLIFASIVLLNLLFPVCFAEISETGPELHAPFFDNNSTSLLECANLANQVQLCWQLESGLADTCSEGSPANKCATSVVNTYPPCNIEIITRFVNTFVRGIATSDKLLCKDNLYKDFEKSPSCWQIAQGGAALHFRSTKGFLTDDGCEAIRLDNEIYKAILPSCANLFENYLDPLLDQSSCGKSFKTDSEQLKQMFL